MLNKRIKKIQAREILDSRGNPTVEVEIHAGGLCAREQVPSGASTGFYEAKELRDGGKRYHGRGVRQAVHNVGILARHVNGFRMGSQELFDEKIVSVNPSKVKLGANAMLGLSLAYARLSAACARQTVAEYIAERTKSALCMPVPFMNIINGGEHAGNGLAFQEHMIVPQAKTFAESLRIGSEVYHELKGLLKQKNSSWTNIGDEGGFAPDMTRVTDPFAMMQKAVDRLGYSKYVSFAIDAAANSFYDKKKNRYRVGGKALTTRQLMKVYEKLAREYPLVSIEDPFEEHKFDDYAELNARIGSKVQIVGDDLTVSQPERVQMALDEREIGCLLLKVNQVGTVSEALEAAQIARDRSANVMVSHRSGETESTFIADLAVGLGCGQIKTGAPARGERTAKYNQLLRLEEFFGKRIQMAPLRLG